jgi:hypothetical protein
MRFGRLLLSSALVLTISLPCLAKTRHHSLHKIHLKRHSSKARGQQSIDDQRATQIQAALVKSGYLSSGQASGHWDAATQSAMQKYQGDHGWQTKLTPDSRAIIKLGLGPAQDIAPLTPVTASASSSLATTTTPGSSFLGK